MTLHRSTFVALTAITDPTIRKRGNPFAGRVRKVSILNGVINWAYSSSVNRQRKREGREADFKAHRRQWGSRVQHTPLVAHVEAGSGATILYLEVKVQSRWEHFFIRHDDEIEPCRQLHIGELWKWLPVEKLPQARGRQGNDKPVILRDFRCSNIAEITLAKERIQVTPAVEELQSYFPPTPAPSGRPALSGLGNEAGS